MASNSSSPTAAAQDWSQEVAEASSEFFEGLRRLGTGPEKGVDLSVHCLLLTMERDRLRTALQEEASNAQTFRERLVSFADDTPDKKRAKTQGSTAGDPVARS